VISDEHDGKPTGTDGDLASKIIDGTLRTKAIEYL